MRFKQKKWNSTRESNSELKERNIAKEKNTEEKKQHEIASQSPMAYFCVYLMCLCRLSCLENMKNT